MTERRGAALSLEGVSFSYEATPVIHDFSLQVAPGEMIALVGASGCGKTTVLKLIAGLLIPSAGTIAIDGQSANATPVEKRRAGIVFQKPLLFPYLSVAENVGFSLKMRGAPRSEIVRRVEEALAMVRLEGYGLRRPSQLSGGQEQRVALARALVSDPRVLLLDEPFSSLDENLRVEIRALVRAIQRKLGITAVFVTHDRVEAATVAHRIAFLHEGQVAQCGILGEFYRRPSTLDAARFFGWQILAGTQTAGILDTALGSVRSTGVSQLEGEVWAAFRPEAVNLGGAAGAVTTVENSVDIGSRVRTLVSFSSGETIETDHAPPEFAPGQTVAVSVPVQAILLFARR